MNLTESHKLLRDYADNGDEAAFRRLVENYINLVYSAAIRRVGGDAALAQDVTQTVFTDLARKASSLRNVGFLGGWLHRHTGFVASTMLRSEQRRQVREQEAVQMNATQDSPDSLWQQLAPMLDDAIESLEPTDRQVVLLRFFERQDFRSIGTALGTSDDAAQKRVSRALEKLRALLEERGVTLSVILLSSLLAGKTIMAAPAGLVGNVTRLALAGGGAGGGLGMAGSKLWNSLAVKLAVGAAAVVIALLVHQSHRSAAVTHRELPPSPAQPIAEASGPVVPANAMPMTPSVSETNSVTRTNNVLLLDIVTADSGKPVPNVELDYLVWENGHGVPQTPLVANRFGVCDVPVPSGISELRLVSQRDGFANTRLDWRLDRGEQIPTNYTLRLARAVTVSGVVFGPDGNPVAGAKVHFEPRPPSPQTRPQSDDFPWNFDTTTDDQGHWQMSRMGDEAFKSIRGSASHPDFVGSPFVNFSTDSEARNQLLAGTYVFTLRHGVVVRGLVTSPDGQPVPDADVLVGNAPGELGARKAKTGSDGTFQVPGCQTGGNRITAEAKGYAAKSIGVELSDTNSGPFHVSLAPGKVLKLRVVDDDGNPVPQASVALLPRPDLPMSGDPEPTAPPIRFNRQADDHGRLEWDSAPDAELTFIVSAPGHMAKRDVKVQPDGIEHVVTLGPGLAIWGTVRDATTGQPIPQFRIIAGWPEGENTNRPHWSSFQRDWYAFEGGKFQLAYEAPMVLNQPNPVYMFKFEADGYRTFVTRALHATKRSVQLDVALARGATTEVTVFAPDQSIAAGTQVGIVYPGAGLVLIPGGFSLQTIESATATALRTTDKQGHFMLPPDPAITKIVVANPQGYAEVTPAELAKNPVIQMAPWGRVEGILVTNGQPLADCTVSVGFGQGQVGLRTISCGYPRFQAKTDGQGRFTFTQVPTGVHNITLVTPFTDKNGFGGWTEIPLKEVTVSPNGTTTMTVDITSRVTTSPEGQ